MGYKENEHSFGVLMRDHPSSRRAVARQVAAVTVLLPLLVGAVLAAFAWTSARTAPRDLPVGVVANGSAGPALTQALDGAGFAVRHYADERAAREAIEHRDVYGAIVAGTPTTVLTASAASAVVATVLTGEADELAPGAVRAVDVVPLSSHDPRGTVLASAALPLIIGGMLIALVVSVLLRPSSSARTLALLASASGVAAGQNAKSECCEGHGAVVALSLKDGRKLWEYHTMKDAEYNGQTSSTGVKQKGPSGAPIWALPTIDEARNRVIVATGENTSHPATGTSDAIIAIDLDTGKSAWVFQAMQSDVWNMACNDRDLPKSGSNCARLFGGEGRDFDFGATPMLIRNLAGRDIVVDGQKSGHVWALDAATGKMLWNHQVGEGGVLGGVHWGVATDGKAVFATISDSILRSTDWTKAAKPGVYAFRLSDGKPLWSHTAVADCEGARGKAVADCATKFGFSAAPLVVAGQVVAGRLDGKLVVLDGQTGAVLRTVDTLGPVPTVNGVPGKGGSIDSHAVSAGDGMVFVTSGYGAFGQTPGNVLIALKPKA